LTVFSLEAKVTETEWSEWRVREEAGGRGYPTSHEQFELYVGWGLLFPTPHGRWPVWTVDRLVEIRQAESVARPMPRRVVRLRGNYQKFPVPPRLVQRAMVEMVGPRSIKAPKRKLRQINTAINKVLGKAAVAANPPVGRSPFPPVPAAWLNPHPSEWQRILRAPWGEQFLETRVAFQYHTNDSYGVMGADVWPSEHQIPFEERILLLTVRELSVDYQRTMADVADKLRRLPGSPVKEVALIPNEPHGVLYVVLSDGAQPDAAQARHELKERLRQTSTEEWIASEVVFVDQIPRRTAS
jgi:hypothetical protein